MSKYQIFTSFCFQCYNIGPQKMGIVTTFYNNSILDFLGIICTYTCIVWVAGWALECVSK